MAIKALLPTRKPARWPFDMRALWRLGVWGASAGVALTALVIVLQSDIGAQRLHATIAKARDAATPALPAAAQNVARNPDAESETRWLSEAVRVLAFERERLNLRVASLERNLEDITGSIKNASAAAPPPVAAPAVAGTAIIAPLVPSFSPVSVSDKLASVWQSAPEPPEPVATAAAIGVDIGGAASMQALRSQWTTAKANYGPLFEGLRPVVAVREIRPGVPELRLIVGPLANPVAAAKLCAALTDARVSCRKAVFEGQRLTLKQAHLPR